MPATTTYAPRVLLPVGLAARHGPEQAADMTGIRTDCPQRSRDIGHLASVKRACCAKRGQARVIHSFRSCERDSESGSPDNKPATVAQPNPSTRAAAGAPESTGTSWRCSIRYIDLEIEQQVVRRLRVAKRLPRQPNGYAVSLLFDEDAAFYPRDWAQHSDATIAHPPRAIERWNDRRVKIRADAAAFEEEFDAIVRFWLPFNHSSWPEWRPPQGDSTGDLKPAIRCVADEAAGCTMRIGTSYETLTPHLVGSAISES